MEKCLVSSVEQEGIKDRRRLGHLDVAASRKFLKTQRIQKDSETSLKRLPLAHVSFNYDNNGKGFKSIKYVLIYRFLLVVTKLWLFVSPWTVARQAPPSMGEY